METWTRASHSRWPARFIDLRKVDITPAQCAFGFRAPMVMINLGVKDDNFESFILEVYNHSKDLGLSQENIATHMKDLVGFSKTVPLSLSEVPSYIKQKTHEKEKLDTEIEALKDQIATIKQKRSDSDNKAGKIRHRESTSLCVAR